MQPSLGEDSSMPKIIVEARASKVEALILGSLP
jgi:hypothetical protein